LRQYKSLKQVVLDIPLSFHYVFMDFVQYSTGLSVSPLHITGDTLHFPVDNYWCKLYNPL